VVVAEVLDFPGVASQGFDLPDARLMIGSALEDVAHMRKRFTNPGNGGQRRSGTEHPNPFGRLKPS
jgi:hypothetical protein